ncbi:DNA mismatch repair endonuclease MutL [Acerihabitans arboris]|uniref:DNA mismatch repair protein MutL n=1 Tax=Acerihabitans arboris TaxID=2691583 RepID=A0A845SJD2_9GAMM|nr:DNA mismatch repair endonuclease MutL [Acerihabitans arboris]NDL61445.1 DNA mismatch repair endonuclease MutL [Acerihabitans arboris]
MPIQVLPPQLANQIAAGEVVERPASVVKELVENSLDAGATRIDIDIEKAGARLIRIRDNGCGIDKDELALALARHATSKIVTLDDLEAIISLGFRGEALASISSVSRLTLTSRTEAQSEAWQAYAEGRDMTVTIKPAAHPVGSTVEVLDLFYNTPARRKFMRTEKTEFAHIDEVVKRIALARFDVTFTLSHNGKPVRQYRAVTQEAHHLRRLGSLCGPAFVQRALAVSWSHGDLTIRGWVADPRSGGELPEMQYCYVNQRMMRDKLINHAIRQAYQEQLTGGQQPAFVLYLDVDPHQVDVNVHPAKHEVRFHQARLVHDFIYQAIISVLQQGAAPTLPLRDEAQPAIHWSPENRPASGKNSFAGAAPPSPAPLFPAAEGDRRDGGQLAGRPSVAGGRRDGDRVLARTGDDVAPPAGSSRGRMREPAAAYPAGPGYQKKEGELYRRLIQPGAPARDERTATALPSATAAGDPGDAQSFGRVLSIYPPCYALVEFRQRLALISLPVAERCLKHRQLTPDGEGLRAQPLLIPLRMALQEPEVAAYHRHQAILNELGIQLQVHQHQATLNGVPLPLRQQNLQNLIPELLGYLSAEDEVSTERVADWIAGRLSSEQHDWSLSQAIQLLAEVERLCPQWVKTPPGELLVMLDLGAAVEALKHD